MVKCYYFNAENHSVNAFILGVFLIIVAVNVIISPTFIDVTKKLKD